MTGQDMVDLGNLYLGEPYQLNTVVPKNNANWKGPWNCSEFASWLVYQTTSRLYGCANDDGNPARVEAYTGYWKADAENKGRIVPVAEAAQTPGAALLRLAVPGGLMGHIAISDGKGGTVEAHSATDGVINSVVSGRRWDFGILIPGLLYEPLEPVSLAPPPVTLYRYNEPLMYGPIVKSIQKALTSAGFSTNGIDGRYGLDTLNAVLAYQAATGLVVDGEVGVKTAAALGIKL